jgi:Flp pilus assembly protein TadG
MTACACTDPLREQVRQFNNIDDVGELRRCDHRACVAGKPRFQATMRSNTGMRRKRRASGDHGAAAVEFALLLPFLALLVCGVIDLGRWYSAWNETKNAAREGALYAQTHPNQQVATGTCVAPNNIPDRAKQELSKNASDTSFTVTITPKVNTCNPLVPAVPSPSCTGGANGISTRCTITVTVTRIVPLITPLIHNLVGDVKIKAKVQTTVLG